MRAGAFKDECAGKKQKWGRWIEMGGTQWETEQLNVDGVRRPREQGSGWAEVCSQAKPPDAQWEVGVGEVETWTDPPRF